MVKERVNFVKRAVEFFTLYVLIVCEYSVLLVCFVTGEYLCTVLVLCTLQVNVFKVNGKVPNWIILECQ